MLLNRLEIRNMRKIKQAEIDFHGPGIQVIKGMNRSGKTTIGQAIALTMNGSKEFAPGMITQGEEEAEIIAYTDDELKIRTVITGNVKQSVARYDEGLQRHVGVSGGVRTFLDSICSGLEQPWALRDIPDVDLVEMLMNRSGASDKIDAIDASLTDKERLRTETGRDLKKEGDPPPVEKAEHPKPIDAIKADREKSREYQKAYGDAQGAAQRTIQAALGNAYTLEELENITPVIKKEVAAARQALTGYKAYTKADIERLDTQLTEWFEAEEKAKKYDAYVEKTVKITTLDNQYKSLTAEIEELRAQRKKVLSDMNLGIKGLEIGEDNMLYHNGVLRGITKTQKNANWSTAESVQVFFGLGARFAGKMKVLVVDNAESLDTKTTGTISKWAEGAGFLVIMLRVAEIPEELEDGVIYVREGEVITKEEKAV